MSLDEHAQPKDHQTEQDGIRILIDPLSAVYLEGAEVDFAEDSRTGGGFTVRPARTTFGCGCGRGGHGDKDHDKP